jgi:hypothetical protein
MSDGKPALSALNLTVVYRPTNSIKPESRNARTHSKKQIAEIAASIREFGFANPLLIDVDGVLIAGHGRLLAAKSIGLDSVPTITLPHLDEAQRRALRLADNKIALNAGWDVDLLKLELKELAELEIDFDLSVTGFSTGEIDVLLASKGDPDDETIPAVPAQPRTRLGDIWICGQHRVGCGDGRDLDFLSKVIGDDAAIDAAFLDPPYNVRISGHANAKGRHREFAMASGEMTLDSNEAAQERLEEIQAFRRKHDPDLDPMDDLTIVRTIVSPDNPNHALRLLKMAVKLYPFQPHAQIKLEPWLVQRALDRLGDRRLDATEQATVVDATRTPGKVRWPDWWET